MPLPVSNDALTRFEAYLQKLLSLRTTSTNHQSNFKNKNVLSSFLFFSKGRFKA